MKAKNKFEEMKINLVMKLRKMDRSAARQEIARLDAFWRKAREGEAADAQKEAEARRAAWRKKRGLVPCRLA